MGGGRIIFHIIFHIGDINNSHSQLMVDGCWTKEDNYPTPLSLVKICIVPKSYALTGKINKPPYVLHSFF